MIHDFGVVSRMSYEDFMRNADDSLLRALGYEERCGEAYSELQEVIYDLEGWKFSAELKPSNWMFVDNAPHF